MEWISQHLFATVSGWDILIWAGAYGVWRYLTAEVGQSTCNTDLRVPGVVDPVAVPRESGAVAPDMGRWQRRDILLQKQRESLAYRHRQRRRVQRAA